MSTEFLTSLNDNSLEEAPGEAQEVQEYPLVLSLAMTVSAHSTGQNAEAQAREGGWC